MAGLYLHIPFCDHKCLYCDFYSTESLSSMDRFIEAITAEIEERAAGARTERFDTIFFGGGTPSLLDASVVGSLIGSLHNNYTINGDAEVTLETNPGTVDTGKLRELRSAGVNRLSVGVQSSHDDELKMLTRIHTAAAARDCVLAAREAGFENLNLDLIFALPGQTPAKWDETLSWTLALDPPHISAYCLIYEEGTPLVRLARAKQISPLPGEVEAGLYEATMKRLRGAGYEQYEISNFAKPGYRCRHNLTYWRHATYLGFGPSAHSFRGKRRWWNVPDVAVYNGNMLGGVLPVAGEETLGQWELFEEMVMLGMRTGRLDLDGIRSSTGIDIRAGSGGSIREILAGNLAVFEAPLLNLTQEGFMVCDELSARIISDCDSR